MLQLIARDVQRHYYDPSFHGVDWDATVLEAKQRIQSAPSVSMAVTSIAFALDSLNDSHTFFVPPPRQYNYDYGFQTQMIGDRCYVIRVRPGSDAETQGLKPGVEVLALEGFRPERDTLWRMDYTFGVLRPQSQLRLLVRDVQGRQRQIDVAAKVKESRQVESLSRNYIAEAIRRGENKEHLLRPRWVEAGDEIWILKLPVFLFDRSDVMSMMRTARKRQALILDLRGNTGGAVETLKYLLGGIFENDVEVGEHKGRKESKPEVAKTLGHDIFRGKLVVLVDSKSASAAEIFARIVQIEKRGLVVGDRSAGRVMEAKRYSYHIGLDSGLFFGASITEADLIMSDGKSLEHTGVTPDELVLPTAADLASGRDPVLPRAAAVLGANLAPEDAGKMFPYEWPSE